MNKSRKFLSMVLAALLTLTFLSGVAQATVPAAKDGVVIATAQEPTHFFNQDEQYLTSQAKDGPVLMQLYDTLYWMGEDGSCQPSLATSYEVSDDGMEYVFELRDDVYFHNGEKMTAEDVAFTYNLCVEKNAQLTKNLLMNFKEAQVVDDTHVKMVLSSPFPAFLAETTSRVGFVICKSYYEQVGSEGYDNAPIGTGAYKFVERVSGSHVKMEAFDNYWNGAPSIKYVTVKPISDVSTQFISLDSGDIDVVVAASIPACLHLDENSKATWAEGISASRTALYLNETPAGAPLVAVDENLRKAIQYGVNPSDLIAGVLSGHGLELDMDCVPTYQDAPKPGTYTPRVYDMEKAKEFLAKSNYKGEQLKLITLSANERDAQIIQGDLMMIGINIDVVPCDTATYYGYLMGALPYDMYIAGTTSSLNDVSSLLTQYQSNPLTPDLRRPNYEELDALCIASNTEMDHDKRAALFAQIITIENERAVVVPLYSQPSSIAFNKALNGVQAHPQGAIRVWEWNWNK